MTLRRPETPTPTQESTFVSLVNSLYQEKSRSGKNEIMEQLQPLIEKLEKDPEAYIEQLRSMMKFNLSKALGVLRSNRIRGIFETVGSLSPEEFIGRVGEFNWLSEVHQIRAYVQGVAAYPVSAEDENIYFHYPFNKLKLPVTNELGITASNLGHDIRNLPVFHDFSTLLWNLVSRGKRDFKDEIKLATRIYPQIYESGLLMLTAFINLIENDFPQSEINLSEIIEIVGACAAQRAFCDTGNLTCNTKGLNFNGQEFKNTGLSEQLQKYTHGFFDLKVDIEPNLQLIGNAAGLFLLFYQFIKNSVAAIKETPPGQVEPRMSLVAKQVDLEKSDQSQKIIAVQITDGGLGLDFAKILRAKQRLIQSRAAKGEEISAQESKTIDKWASLDLSLAEIISFIFERKISGADRKGPHSGIGLALAREIIDQHGGCIWATNTPGKIGANFLILLDPTSEGKLRENFPELFPGLSNKPIPNKLLNQIESQI